MYPKGMCCQKTSRGEAGEAGECRKMIGCRVELLANAGMSELKHPPGPVGTVT